MPIRTMMVHIFDGPAPFRRCLPLLTLLLCILAGFAPADAQTGLRHALVIGNADYSFGRLNNPLNDARVVSGVLAELGFSVTSLENGDHAGMHTAVRRITDGFARGGIGLFYFAGHAVQHADSNYLLPVDYRPTTPGNLRADAIDVGDVIEAMEAARSMVKILILDSCRNTPFTDPGSPFGSGLARVGQVPDETLVAYATTSGTTASDGVGPNSPYTAALVSALEQPGADVLDVFNRVRLNVREATQGRQLPWVSGSLDTPLRLREAGETGASLPEGEVTVAGVHWQTIRNSVDPSDFRTFLAIHPRTPQARQAAEALRTLTAQGRTAPAQVQVPTQVLPVPGDLSVTVTPCDVWASNPHDPQRLVPGVEWGLVNTREAIRDCAVAVAAEPENPRLLYNLGRALDIAERFAEAEAFYRRAADARYSTAFWSLGYMYRNGRGRVRDLREAAGFYARAALLGNPAARSALSK
ncbi:MAG TPA: caspase family protein, partial [Arenibaculum sp.]|nr:caspase family protein [Arenibaculum sp.]